ncbi:Oidioi.mRNA.OKI2018_I69.chr1.g1117.t1.cds [Oikopleura dioica]|uniref:Oidioi.mRNA.OKI2018_I69.chr1.g1117.t1.cds n=1 Tax=Oikopleura dioica TaxID=34765 RepID=A0ABN7SRY8_OIKDI|nr:Oidioi.mRNA.OKI2018_I69.chr1.g1117.t1.cds [Oikopleura dioica]
MPADCQKISEKDKEIKEEPQDEDQSPNNASSSSSSTVKSEPEDTYTFGQQPTEPVEVKGSVKSASKNQALEIIDLDESQETQSIQAEKNINKRQNRQSTKQASQKGKKRNQRAKSSKQKNSRARKKIAKKPEPVEEKKHTTDEEKSPDEITILAPAENEPSRKPSFTMVLRSASRESGPKEKATNSNSVGGSDSEDTKSLLDSPEEDEKIKPPEVKTEPKTFDCLERTNEAVHEMHTYVTNLALQSKLEEKDSARYKTIMRRRDQVLPDLARMQCQSDIQLTFAKLAASGQTKVSANALRKRNKELTIMGIGEKLTVGKTNKTLEVFAKIVEDKNAVKYLLEEFFDEHFDNYWQMMTKDQQDCFLPQKEAPEPKKRPTKPPKKEPTKRKVGRPKKTKKKQTAPNPNRPMTRSRSKQEVKEEPKEESIELKEEPEDV